MNEQQSTDHRAAMKRALSVAETITSRCPINEYDSIDASPQGVKFFAYNRPENVALFAETLGLELAFRVRADERPYIEAKGDVDGVPVQVWALGEVAELELYAACVPVPAEAAPGVESLPVAWSVAAVSA